LSSRRRPAIVRIVTGHPGARVVVGDDSEHVRDALSLLLADAGYELAGAAGDARTLVAVSEAVRPDLLVTDVRMPPQCTDDGLRAAVELRRRHPELRVLLLSHQVQRCYAEELLAAGAGGTGYLLKQRAADVSFFVESLHEVLRGGTVLDRELAVWDRT
jgi:DNA-binding NarL/FixJ family response regulator